MLLFLCLFSAFDELACVVGREPITKEEITYLSIFYPGVGYDDLVEKAINSKVIEYIALEETLTVNQEEISQMKDEILANTPGIAGLLENDFVNKLYDEQVRAQILTNKLIGLKFREKLKVSPAEIQKFYQNHKDSFMIPKTVTISKIQTPILSPENNYLLSKAQKILDEYKEGTKFPSLVNEYSDDAATIPYGGKLGKFTPTDIPPHLIGVLELKEGEAEIFESPTGYHIIKLDKREGLSLSLSQILLQYTFSEEKIRTAEEKALEIRKHWSSGTDSAFSDQIEVIGPIPIQALTPVLASLVDTMKTGQISEPILEGNILHLLKIKSKDENRIPEFSEIKDRLSGALMQQKMMKLIDEWLKKEKEHIFIKKI
jgi:peptidyl-prolyl cis-trans isomerase SurA